MGKPAKREGIKAWREAEALARNDSIEGAGEMSGDDPVWAAVHWLEHNRGLTMPSADIRHLLIAACEAKADSLSAPLPGNAYPLEWQEIVQRFLREWAREMKATNPSS